MFNFWKRKYPLHASESITHITNEICKNDDLIRYLYYSDFDPLSKPKLTIDEKRKMLGVHIIPSAPPPIQPNPKSELRIYFKQSDAATQRTHDILFVCDIIIPDELLYTKYGQRNYLIAEEFLNCQGIFGFANIGKSNFDRFEQIPYSSPSSCLRLTAKSDLWR